MSYGAGQTNKRNIELAINGANEWYAGMMRFRIRKAGDWIVIEFSFMDAPEVWKECVSENTYSKLITSFSAFRHGMITAVDLRSRIDKANQSSRTTEAS